MNTVKETRLAQQRAYDAQQKEISHILEFINKHDERPKIVAQKAGPGYASTTCELNRSL